MEKEYVMQIAQTIQEQLIGLTPMPVLMSWGIAEFAATIFKDLPALRIKVNGLLHTGYVIIALNDGGTNVSYVRFSSIHFSNEKSASVKNARIRWEQSFNSPLTI